MKKFKRIFAVFFCLLLAAGILGGCGKAASSSAPAPSALQSGNKPLKIVTTIFPEYDWVREILGDKADHAEVTMLLGNGVDLHSYQPTADDIIKNVCFRYILFIPYLFIFILLFPNKDS